jgi:hypothetical protein
MTQYDSEELLGHTLKEKAEPNPSLSEITVELELINKKKPGIPAEQYVHLACIINRI